MLPGFNLYHPNQYLVKFFEVVMNILSPQITIDIWSDFVCPWCWIAKKRFEKALDVFENKDNVLIRHHSYRIAGEFAPAPFKAAMYKKFGTEQGAELMMKQIKIAGESEGLLYNFDTMLFGDTKDAHAMVKMADQVGLGEKLAERLFMASITEGRSIFDHKELVAISTEVGVSPTDAENALNSRTLRDAIISDENNARAIGASGVPLFLLNNRYSLSGAQPASSFLGVLQQAWADKQNEVVITKGQSCEVGGCSI
ncbi:MULTISPECIES: DsbA family oxidoreductase [Aeromonas]|uniref:DsbA family oxidoreductase n=1 Tax=Aeromonas TaxID=642 RepID=UPI0020B1056E|nr:DsbA family oxidoreductase [Aeromonas caviae]